MTYNHHIVGPFARMDPDQQQPLPESYYDEMDDDEMDDEEQPMRYKYVTDTGFEGYLEPPAGQVPPDVFYMPTPDEDLRFSLVGQVEDRLEVDDVVGEPDDVVVSSGASIPVLDDIKHVSEYSYEEMMYAPVGSKVLTVLFKLRELAELVGVEVNTQAPLADGTYSPFQQQRPGQAWRSKTITELVSDINRAL